jgi:hypothetical protein
MKNKKTVFFLINFVILLFISNTFAVDTFSINKVRSKSVLDDSDRRIIDEFISQAVSELTNTTDFSSIATIRNAIVQRKDSEIPDQLQYHDQFRESCVKYIPSALKNSMNLSPQSRRFMVCVNLLMLIDGLGNMNLIDSPISMLDDKDAALRYWAVHAITNNSIVTMINEEPKKYQQQIAKIISELVQRVDSMDTDSLALMIEFARNITAAEGKELLLKIADSRINKYAQWSVKNELLDSNLIKALYSKIEDEAEIGRRFGQLFSYVFQRYIKGQDVLDADQKEQLVSVLVEAEQSCIARKPLDMMQANIKRAIGQKDFTSLKQEHDRLLGSETAVGVISEKLGFDYGENADGSAVQSPKVLAEPAK